MRFVPRNVELEQAGARLEGVMAGSMRRVPRNEAPVLAWPLVCGSAVAERTQAVTFAAGILRVQVADTGWKRELQALAPRYLAMINRYAGQTVSRIEFVVVAPELLCMRRERAPTADETMLASLHPTLESDDESH